VRVCGEVRASPAENDEVQFLCTLCAKIKADPYLVNFFIEVRYANMPQVTVEGKFLATSDYL